MKSRSVYLCTLAATTTMAGATAHAQPAVQLEADDAAREIVVTAQKRTERLSDVPISITAVSGDQLVKQGLTSPADLERVVPGFTFAQGQYGSPIFTIRGIGFNNEAVSAQPDVTIHVDQIPLPYSRMSEGASLDLERVEVLKGPQGTLFGQNATGGVINYIAAKPTDAFHFGADATYGRFNQLDIGGFVSAPIALGLQARIAVRTEQRGDWQKNATRDETLGQRNFLVGRILLDWQPSDRLDFELNVNGWRDRSDTQIYQARGYLQVNPPPPGGFLTPQVIATTTAEANYPYQTGNNARLADWDPNRSYRQNDRFKQVSLRSNVKIGKSFDLVSLTNYAQIKSSSPVDLDGTPASGNFLIQRGNLRTFSQEVRLEGKISDRVNVVLGGYYQRDHTLDLENIFLSGTNAELDATYLDGGTVIDDQRVRIAAGFAGIDLKLTDTLILQGSARYTDVRTKFEGCLLDSGTANGIRLVPRYRGLNFGAGVAPGACTTIILPAFTTGMLTDTLPEDNVAWRANLSWKPNADMLFYANVSKGYKSGAYNNVPAITADQAAPVTQESVLAYEAGFKVSAIGRALDLSGAIFHYRYNNKQIQTNITVFLPSPPFPPFTPFGNFPALVNIPHSSVDGVELSATLRPTAGLRLTGGITYVDTTVKGSTFVTSAAGAVVDVNGEHFPLTPKWHGVANVDYDFPLSATLNGFLGTSLSYRSGTTGSFGAVGDDRFSIPSYTLVDARIGIETQGGKWRFQIWGKNIFDKQYWNVARYGYDTHGRIYGMPATYGISAGTRF